MKKFILIILFFLIIYLGLRVEYRFFGDGHKYTYTIKTNDISFEVKEEFVNDKNNSNYYFSFKKDDELFYYKTFNNFKNQAKIVKDIYYYESEKYKCILPIYKNNLIISDILCKDGSYTYFYHDLKDLNKELDDFALSLSSIGYNVENWIDSSEFVKDNNLSVYKLNIPNNHIIALTDYKGLNIVNKQKITSVPLFNSDVYQKKINIIYQNKYLVADYNAKYRFHELYLVDLLTGEKSTIISDKEISFDSYIQGVVDGKVYLYDRDSKKQFAINIDKKEVFEVGNQIKGIMIFNGEDWEQISALTASKEKIKFYYNEQLKNYEQYDKVYQYGTEKYGYYYYFKKVDDRYLVYRSSIKNDEQLTYLFTTTNIDNIIFYNQYIYFIEDDFIKNYSDQNGVKKVIQYKELKFNDNLYFNVYQK